MFSSSESLLLWRSILIFFVCWGKAYNDSTGGKLCKCQAESKWSFAFVIAPPCSPDTTQRAGGISSELFQLELGRFCQRGTALPPCSAHLLARPSLPEGCQAGMGGPVPLSPASLHHWETSCHQFMPPLEQTTLDE